MITVDMPDRTLIVHKFLLIEIEMLRWHLMVTGNVLGGWHFLCVIGGLWSILRNLLVAHGAGLLHVQPLTQTHFMEEMEAGCDFGRFQLLQIYEKIMEQNIIEQKQNKKNSEWWCSMTYLTPMQDEGR